MFWSFLILFYYFALCFVFVALSERQMLPQSGMANDRQQRNRRQCLQATAGKDAKVAVKTFFCFSGGLLVALVIKHADNILRGFATALETWWH